MSKYIGEIYKLLRESVKGLATSSETIQNKIYNIYLHRICCLSREFEWNSLNNRLEDMNKKTRNKVF